MIPPFTVSMYRNLNRDTLLVSAGKTGSFHIFHLVKGHAQALFTGMEL